MKKRTIQISLPSTGEDEWQALRDPIMSGWLTQGTKVAEFEKAFALRHQVSHAIATTSCTTALHLILAAMDIGAGDEVIVPAFTWVATANAVLYTGATPVFVDVCRNTYNMDIQQVGEKVTERTKAIIPVHLFGLPVDMDELQKVAGDIPLVGDAACAAASVYKGTPVGKLGIAAAFSFHPRKVLTTGEGGMITTDDDALAEKINCLRNHGAAISEEQRHLGPKPFLLPEFQMMGFNYRMTDLQGAVGSVQLAKLEKFHQERQEWANYFTRELEEIPWLVAPHVPDNVTHGWQAYVCYCDEKLAPATRNDLMERLQEDGISVRPGTHAVHMLEYYRNRFDIKANDFPEARDCNDFTIALPLHNKMTEEDYHYIIERLKSY